MNPYKNFDREVKSRRLLDNVMDLFSNEEINISKIYTVSMVESCLESIGKTVHYHAKLPTYELIYILSGEATIRFNGVQLRDKLHSLRYLPKGAPDEEYTGKILKNGICIDIYFDTTDTMPVSALSLHNLPKLENLFIKIYNIWSSKRENYYVDCMSVFYEIIKIIKNIPNKYISNSQSEKINLAHEYMLQNYKDQNFDFKELCKQTGFSYSYFKELFISKYGMPPVKYLTYLRINYAKDLLITSRYTIGQISELCGFENVYYFSTVFKKHIGVSPSKYNQSLDNI